MAMKSRWVLAAFVVVGIFAFNSCINSSNSSSGTSFVWVATQGDQMVRSYKINQENGSISLIGNNGNPVATGVQPTQMIITPDGKSVFIVNSGANGTAGNITAYTFNGDGSLAAAGNGVAAGTTPIAMAIDPTGKFLFVANQGTASDVTSGTISVFSISSTSLTQVSGSPFPTETASDVSGTGPSAVAVSPVSNFLYVANQFTNTVESFSYDSSGALTLVASYAAGANPAGLAFSRCAGITSSTATAACPAGDADSLFVANSGSNNISIFAACIQVSATCPAANGTLVELSSGSPVTAGVGPSNIFVDRNADFVYAVDRGSNQVSEYSYSPATGVLTSLGATGSGGASVFSGGITANAANNVNLFNWIVVSNNGASSLSIFRVGATGRLTGLSSGQFALQGQPSAILLR